MAMPLVAEVVFPLPLFQSFDYEIPEPLRGTIRVGHRVLVPFGKRRPQIGVVAGLAQAPADGKFALKPLLQIVEDPPALTEKDVALGAWMSERYFCSKGEGIFSVLPVGQRRPPKFQRAARPAPPLVEHVSAAKPDQLTKDQTAVIPPVLAAIDARRFEAFLLFGVAAAGKTEVYMRCMEACLAQGRSVIYLVPEIGLTPQTESILRGRFKEKIEVWHSQMSQGERWRIWERARKGECRIVLGPRSALFLPLPDPGLIVLDEEHDPSYKEDSRPSYHAREAAIQKGRLHGAAVLLGSATPSLESYGQIQRTAVKQQFLGQRCFPSVRM
jgi:primosomal protein N' (replication factor Y)